MANKKFSEFVLKTNTSGVSHIVGYSGTENVQITPANFVTTGGTGIFLPLAGGTMTGALVVDSTATVNDILTAGLGLALTGGTVGSGKLVLASSNKVHLSGGSAGLILQNSGGTKSLTIDDTLSTFVGLVSGITPVDGANFVTKAYVDGGGGLTGFLPLSAGSGFPLTGEVYFDKGVRLYRFTDQVNFWSVYTNTDDSLRFNYNGAGGDEIIIDSSGDTTFTGSVSITEIASIINDSGISGLQIRAKADNICYIDFGDSADANIGGINYSNVTDKLNFRTGNSNKVTLDASGNLIVGASSVDTAGSFSIKNDGSLRGVLASGTVTDTLINAISGVSNGLQITNDASNNQNYKFHSNNGALSFIVNNAGNVGVGTQNPVSKLSINAPAPNFANGANAIGIDYLGGSEINDIGGGLIFSQKWFSGANDTRVTGGIYGIKTQAGGAFGGGLAFYTQPNSGSAMAQRMILDNNGNLGIGSSPISSARLTLGTGALANEIISFAPATGGSAEFRNTSSTGFFNWTNNDGGSQKMRLGSTGALLVGTSSTLASRLVLAAPSGTSNIMCIKTGSTSNSNVGAIIFQNSGGSQVGQITVNGATGVTAYITSSDYRLKEDLQDFKGLDMISKIPVYDYKWKVDESRSYGVMAHQLQEVLPDAVSGDKDAEEMQGVDYSKIVPLLVKAIQELKAEIELLKK